jgi:hypothetical protein
VGRDYKAGGCGHPTQAEGGIPLSALRTSVSRGTGVTAP